MRARSRLSVLTGTMAALVSAGLLFGFVLFAAHATRDSAGQSPLADGIVVLTGGELRIAEAGRLLAARRGQRLLVSGVNARTSEADVRRLANLPPTLFACCVDLDRMALDTHGNAIETRNWVERHGFTSLIVVTGSYHMLRSRLELERALPGVVLHAHAVLPRSLRRTWWLSPSNVRLLAGEYLKLLPVAARFALSRPSLATASPRPSLKPPRGPAFDGEATRSVSGRVGAGN